jgi:hypothetical protein
VAKRLRQEAPELELLYDGTDLLISFNGKLIAKRGQPDTPQAGTWVSLEPGWTVEGDDEEIEVTRFDSDVVH